METLTGTIRTYTWGSRTHIAALLGHEVPSPHPQAELWLGAHRDDPSRLIDRAVAPADTSDGPDRSGTAAGMTLTAALEQDPLGGFGPARHRRWSGRLPFLFKVLAAEEPLSLQAHPSAEQAADGYAREEAAGVPRTASERNYPDPLPKPEVLCAISEFHALAGFRDAATTVRLLRALDVPALIHHTELLAAQPDADGLRALFTTWITLPQRAVDDLVPAVLEGCVAHARDHGEFAQEARTLLDLGERYPGDAGVLAALLLNRVVLEPGQVLYQPAGSPHSYLSGCGVELMANSDNVLRCGLTPKHVDVPELLRVLDFHHGPPALVTPDGNGAVRRFTAPADHFTLVRLAFPEHAEHAEDAEHAEATKDVGGADVGGGAADAPSRGAALGVNGPRIVLCVEGSLRLRSSRGQERILGRGDAVWAPACDGELLVEPVTTPVLAFAAADGLDPTGGPG